MTKNKAGGLRLPILASENSNQTPISDHWSFEPISNLKVENFWVKIHWRLVFSIISAKYFLVTDIIFCRFQIIHFLPEYKIILWFFPSNHSWIIEFLSVAKIFFWKFSVTLIGSFLSTTSPFFGLRVWFWVSSEKPLQLEIFIFPDVPNVPSIIAFSPVERST